MPTTTSKINSTLDAQQDEMNRGALLGAASYFQGKVSKQTLDSFLSVVGSGDVETITKWCNEQKNPSSWKLMVAICNLSLAERMGQQNPPRENPPSKLHLDPKFSLLSSPAADNAPGKVISPTPESK